jgi:hypothetical protein
MTAIPISAALGGPLSSAILRLDGAAAAGAFALINALGNVAAPCGLAAPGGNSAHKPVGRAA